MPSMWVPSAETTSAPIPRRDSSPTASPTVASPLIVATDAPLLARMVEMSTKVPPLVRDPQFLRRSIFVLA